MPAAIESDPAHGSDLGCVRIRVSTFHMGRTVQFALAFQLAGACLAGQPIGILIDFSNQPESAVVDLMKLEIRQILAPAQLELSFQRIGDSGALQSFRKIVIIRFHGTCQVQMDSGGIQLNQAGVLDYPALGRTEIVGGQIVPYVQVYCNEVRAFVPTVSTISFYVQMYGSAR